MSRPLRIEFPGAVYHVMGRGVGKMQVFDDETDYLKFLSLLGDLVSDRALIVYSFCLIPNHPHILCETPQGQLGRWMQNLFGSYGSHYNRRHGRFGHVWQARYRAILVDNGSYLLDCSRYIHLNPCAGRGLVSAPELWPWSSYRNYVGGPVVAPWVSTELILSEFGGPEQYRDYVRAGMKQKLVSPFQLAKGGLVYGGEAFVARIREMEKARRHRSEVSGRRALLHTEPRAAADLIRALVDDQFADYSACKRGQILGYILHRFTWMKNSEIAELLNRTPPAVTMARARIAQRLSSDGDLAQRVAEIEERLRSSVEQVQLVNRETSHAQRALDLKI
ncbi:MAG TPA: transposase [Acidobacteriota bacterium]|nr:transposase [Acidobacteriota bacterium]